MTAAILDPQTTEQGQKPIDTQRCGALLGTDSPAGPLLVGTHHRVTDGDPTSESGGRWLRDDQSSTAPALGPILADPSLAFAADVLDDLEKTRNANANRLRILTRDEVDSDGEHRGFGLTEDHPDVAQMAAIVASLDGLVKEATKTLERRVRKHPLGPWIKAQRGVGDKTAGRLLAAIGDPYWNTLHDRPRTVSELWAFAGLHTNGESAARRQRGVRANWSTVAKTRAWLVIEASMKQINPACKRDDAIGVHEDGCGCSPYRIVIDERRQRTRETHPDWTPGHSLNDAMRIASKELLKDLWIQARDLHHASE